VTARAFGISIEKATDVPIFQQIADGLSTSIRNGVLPGGARLPPTRDLADALGTHRNTVVRAYEALSSAGFVVSHVGRGTFVTELKDRAAAMGDGRPVAFDWRVAGLPWASLMSRTAASESLQRGDRMARRAWPADAINMSRFEPGADLRPVETFRRCLDHVMRKSGSKAMGYAPREGVEELRVGIAKELVRRGIPASADDVLVTAGSQQAIDLLARALVDRGDAFFVEEPTYSGILNLLSAAGARPVGVPCDDEGPDPDALARLSRPGVKGFYLMPNGSNPTGRTLSLARRAALVSWSRSASVPLIEDDYGADMYLDAPPPPSLRSLDGEVVYVSTFSKKLAPALRCGFMVAPRGLHDHLVPLKHAMDLGSSALLQYALAEFMERGYLAAHLARTRAVYRERRDALVEALNQHLPREVMFERPSSGVLLWLRLPSGTSAEQVFEAAHRYGVLVSPGSVNSVSGQGAAGVRLAFCTETPERLREGAKRLSRAIEAVLGERRSRGPSLDLV